MLHDAERPIVDPHAGCTATTDDELLCHIRAAEAVGVPPATPPSSRTKLFSRRCGASCFYLVAQSLAYEFHNNVPLLLSTQSSENSTPVRACKTKYVCAKKSVTWELTSKPCRHNVVFLTKLSVSSLHQPVLREHCSSVIIVLPLELWASGGRQDWILPSGSCQ